MTVHSFDAQNQRGTRAAAALVNVLRQHGYQVRPATADEQAVEIDYHVWMYGRWFSVEVKVDWRAKDRAFIETQGTQHCAGWGVRCAADLLLYLCPGKQQLWIFRPCKLSAQLPEWQRRFAKLGAQNARYTTVGIGVPFRELRSVAEAVVELRVVDGAEQLSLLGA